MTAVVRVVVDETLRNVTGAVAHVATLAGSTATALSSGTVSTPITDMGGGGARALVAFVGVSAKDPDRAADDGRQLRAQPLPAIVVVVVPVDDHLARRLIGGKVALRANGDELGQRKIHDLELRALGRLSIAYPPGRVWWSVRAPARC